MTDIPADTVFIGTPADIETFEFAHGLRIAPDPGEEEEPTGYITCPWAGTGQFMLVKGTYDGNGNEITPPVYAPEYVVLTRFTAPIAPVATPLMAEWATKPRTTDLPGTNVKYGEWENIKQLNITELEAWCAANDIPHHEWFGGNHHPVTP